MNTTRVFLHMVLLSLYQVAIGQNMDGNLFLSNYSSQFDYNADSLLSEGDSIYHVLFFSNGEVYTSVFHLPAGRKDQTIYKSDLVSLKDFLVEFTNGYPIDSVDGILRFEEPVYPAGISENEIMILPKGVLQLSKKVNTPVLSQSTSETSLFKLVEGK